MFFKKRTHAGRKYDLKEGVLNERNRNMKRTLCGIVLTISLIISFSAITYAETSVSVNDVSAFINGEAGADGKITLYELLELFAEADSDQTDSPETLEQAGYSSENELIRAYIDCLNGIISLDEFYKSFDKTGFMAYWISEDNGRITATDAYAVLNDADKGTAYIIENYPEFCDKWKEYTGETFSDEALHSLTSELSVEDELIYHEFDEFVKETAEKFGPFNNSVQEENFWSSDYGYSTYTISVDDPEDYIQSIGIIFIERNGKYYWVMLHQTA